MGTLVEVLNGERALIKFFLIYYSNIMTDITLEEAYANSTIFQQCLDIQYPPDQGYDRERTNAIYNWKLFLSAIVLPVQHAEPRAFLFHIYTKFRHRVTYTRFYHKYIRHYCRYPYPYTGNWILEVVPHLDKLILPPRTERPSLAACNCFCTMNFICATAESVKLFPDKIWGITVTTPHSFNVMLDREHRPVGIDLTGFQGFYVIPLIDTTKVYVTLTTAEMVIQGFKSQFELSPQRLSGEIAWILRDQYTTNDVDAILNRIHNSIFNSFFYLTRIPAVPTEIDVLKRFWDNDNLQRQIFNLFYFFKRVYDTQSAETQADIDELRSKFSHMLSPKRTKPQEMNLSNLAQELSWLPVQQKLTDDALISYFDRLFSILNTMPLPNLRNGPTVELIRLCLLSLNNRSSNWALINAHAQRLRKYFKDGPLPDDLKGLWFLPESMKTVP